MSVFAGIFAKIIGNAANADGSVIGKLTEGIDNIIVTKNELEEKRLDALAKQMQGQIEINKIEAGHSSIFVAGWRPAIGWVGALSLAYAFILRPLLEWVIVLVAPEVAPPPTIEAAELMTVITGMLGIGAMRSYDKSKNRDTKKIK